MTWKRHTAIATAAFAILAFDAAAEQLVDQDLLYSREIGRVCEIGIWDTHRAKATTLARTESCPRYLYWEPQADTVFFIAGDVIKALELKDPASVSSAAILPSMHVRDYLDVVRDKPDPKYFAMSMDWPIEIVAVMYTDADKLSMHARHNMAAGDSLHLRLDFRNGNWAVTDQFWCGSWETDCVFDELHIDEFGYDWLQDPRDVWTSGIQANRYFVRDEYLGNATAFSPGGPMKRFFEIDGKVVEMSVNAFESAHYDTFYTHEVILVYPSGAAVTICDRQCSAMLVDQYLLRRSITTELYNLGGAQSVLGPLKSAQWIKSRGQSHGEF